MDNVTRYITLIDGKTGAYGVVFPDLPGCTAMGRTVEQALRNASEAAVEWIAATGKAPRPRSFEALIRDPQVRQELTQESAFVVVPVVRETGRPTKANISLDRGLLDAIDEAAAASGLTRSAFLASAAREKITRS